MRTHRSLVVFALLSALLVSACSGESEAAYDASSEAGSADSGALPADAEALAGRYAGLLDEATAALKTVKDEGTARTAVDLISELRPRAEALMAKAEELGLDGEIEERFSAPIDAALERMEVAMQGAIEAYPMSAMMLSSAFGEGFGG